MSVLVCLLNWNKNLNFEKIIVYQKFLAYMIEGIIVTVVASVAYAVLSSLFTDKIRRRIAYRGRLVKDCIFHRHEFIATVVANELDTPLGGDGFIDYGIAERNGYYPGARRVFNIRIDGRLQSVEIPYKELVDFIGAETAIRLDTSAFERPFELSAELCEKTQPAFDSFSATRLLKTNDSTVRVCRFGADDAAAGQYVCGLQKATYYDQVRTNLTLDRLFPGIEEDSVRSIDLGKDKSLRSFEDSIMANTLGVSAIWVMEDGSTPLRKKRLKYFLMPRSRRTGVYNGMLSSVGGVARAPRDGDFPATLEAFAATEMKREFIEESGIDMLVAEGKIRDEDIRLIPLAFVRDLVRGGKPQFFFLISTPHIRSRDLDKAFRKSFNGIEEFSRGSIARMRKMKLSPETLANLLYALAWIQRRRKADFIDLG